MSPQIALVAILDIAVSGFVLVGIILGHLRVGRIAVVFAANALLSSAALFQHVTLYGFDGVSAFHSLLALFFVTGAAAFWSFLLPDRLMNKHG